MLFINVYLVDHMIYWDMCHLSLILGYFLFSIFYNLFCKTNHIWLLILSLDILILIATYVYISRWWFQAIRILEDANLKDDEDEMLQSRALVKLYLNRSMCAIKLEKWDHAITFSNKALYLDPKNAKALYRFVKNNISKTNQSSKEFTHGDKVLISFALIRFKWKLYRHETTK